MPYQIFGGSLGEEDAGELLSESGCGGLVEWLEWGRSPGKVGAQRIRQHRVPTVPRHQTTRLEQELGNIGTKVLEVQRSIGKNRCLQQLEEGTLPTSRHSTPRTYSTKILEVVDKGVARIWFRGGPPISGGGPDPLFFASDPKSQGSPLTGMYFWLPPDFGGGGAGPPPPPPLATPLVVDMLSRRVSRLDYTWGNQSTVRIKAVI